MRPALWVDLWSEEQLMGFNGLNDRSTGNIWMIGRRKPGMSVARAQADLNRLVPQMDRLYPQTDGAMQLELATPG